MNRTTLLLIPWLLGWVGLLILDTPAKASDFCVDSAVTLQNALLRAASNGQDDEINLVQGIYFGNFEYSSIESRHYRSGVAIARIAPVVPLIRPIPSSMVSKSALSWPYPDRRKGRSSPSRA